MNEILQKIRNLKLPKHWEDEGVLPPNEIAINNAYRCCEFIYNRYGIKPSFIACTVVSGLFMSYKGTHYKLVFEIDNENDIGVIVNDQLKKEIVHNEDIKDIENSEALKIFMRKEGYVKQQ